jgi:hypothetical protein
MWVFVPGAFVSIVAHRDKPGTMLVRARRSEDLTRFFGKGGKPPQLVVQETPDADYPFRVQATRARVANLVMLWAMDVDYPNFKAAPGNADRQVPLHAVWGAARGLDARYAAAPR